MNTVGADRRYSVFVSSTYEDLKVERQAVTAALLEAEALPTGMELFPATDDDAWTLIEKVIEECDYYLLILAGKYGSVDTATGMSYTEREFEHARKLNKPVMAFVHRNLDSLATSKSEKNETTRNKLLAFHDKVKTLKHVKYWDSAETLQGSVAMTFAKFPRIYPAVGWVRGDSVASTTALEEIEVLRSELETYRGQSIAVVGETDPRLVEAIVNAKKYVRIRAMNADFLVGAILECLERGEVDVTVLLADPKAGYFSDEKEVRSLCSRSTRESLAANFERTLRALEEHKHNPRLTLKKMLDIPTCTIVSVDGTFIRISLNLPRKIRRLSFQHEAYHDSKHLSDIDYVLTMSESEAESVWE